MFWSAAPISIAGWLLGRFIPLAGLNAELVMFYIRAFLYTFYVVNLLFEPNSALAMRHVAPFRGLVL